MELATLSNLIDGKPEAPAGGAYLDVFEPATGSPYARCPDSDSRDVAAAVAAAERAAPAWAALSAAERAHHLHRLAGAIEARLDELAREESRDSGKPVTLARKVDIPRAVAHLRFFAEAITQWPGESHVDARAINVTLRQPLGVVGCISPWNLPLYLFTWKIAPALAAGNAVVAKPSEVTPFSAFRLSQLAIECGMPPGVLNIVHGLGPKVGQALVEHPKIKAVSFTGSTRTGAAIASAAAKQFKKVSLEMGGKNPAIVFADADLSDANLDTIVWAFGLPSRAAAQGNQPMISELRAVTLVPGLEPNARNAGEKRLAAGGCLQACTGKGRVSFHTGGAPALRPGAIAQSPGREAVLCWASLTKPCPASSVRAREGAGCGSVGAVSGA